ncbi:MAG: outer membrane lipoprotein-sorting protein [Candidatus Marinimicrobia bacterium]|nr:outer membrane lipoprotein-sorting protein [Candidatus Neomarinimicrobiota bacterium]
MRTKIYAVILSIVFSVAILNAQASLTGKQIQQKSIETTRVAGVEAVVTMTIIDSKGRQRVRKLAQISKLYDNGQTEKKLIRFLTPADVKGTGFLTFDYRKKDDDKWLYMPALRKTRRIVSSENAKSFMGSEFSYADMTPPTVEDFTYNILGEEEINGVLCWKIEITPKDDDVADESGFSKKISYIGKQDYVIRRAVYFDLDEELHKELTVHEIKELDTKNHRYRLIHIEVENKQNGRKSILQVEKILFAPAVNDEYFTTRYLERQ